VAHTVILATQEAKIRRIVVQNPLGQIVLETLFGGESGSKPNTEKKMPVEWLKV
jgi:hypothetical protein